MDVVAQDRRITAGHRPGETLEGGEGLRPADAVDGTADTTLELPQCGVGLPTEDAVRATGIEAEFIESSLQGDDIVTAHELPGRVAQDAIAELPARLVEAAQGHRADDAVDDDAAILLECGVIIHRDEELLVQRADYQDLLGHALVQALAGSVPAREKKGLKSLFGGKR